MADALDPELWRRLSPHLDEALELGPAERAAWLEALRARDPGLAGEVEVLLASHEAVEQHGFLAKGPPVPPPPSLAGQVVGAYTLRALVAEGGMGSVWLADRSDGRFEGPAAVKLLNVSLLGPDGEARFTREGSILARLSHPHIAHLIDAGVSPLGQPYLVLEHVDGRHIDAACDERRLSVEARLRLFLDVAAAVSHAHVNLVVHRDIKPSNVLVRGDGQVKLLDFGIAKLLDAEAGGGPGPTREGVQALTPEYAAPEQVTGGHVTTATDVYALGVLLYVLLSGHHPAGEGRRGTAALLRAIVEVDPPRLSEAAKGGGAAEAEEAARRRNTTPSRLRARLQGDLDNIVARALRKRPEERYPSVAALADDVRRHLAHEPVSARADSLRYRAAKFVRRNRAAVQLAALAGLALAAGLAGTVTQARRATRQAARADREALEAREQRDFALLQLARAEAAYDLDTFLLRDAAPGGEPFTVGSLLARAEAIVDRQPDARSRASLRVQVGRQYLMLEQDDKARAVLGRAYDEAVQVADPTLEAEAACELARALALGGQQERGERLFQEAQAKLPAAPQYAPLRVSCLLSGSAVAQERGDARGGLARAQAAQRLLAESRFSSTPLELGVLVRLAESYRLLGDYRQADVAFKDAFARLVALGRDRTDNASSLLMSWGLTLRGLGQTLGAERLLRQAIQIRAVRGSKEVEHATPALLANLSRVLRELDRLPEALHYAELAVASGRRTGQEIAVNQALFVIAITRRQQGDLAGARRAADEVEARFKRLLPPSDLQFASLAMERAQLSMAEGNATAALAAADRAVAMTDGNSQRESYLRRLLLLRSRLNLEGGRVEQAVADARQSLAMELEATPPDVSSSLIGLAHLALGRALQAQGKTEEARRAGAAALAHLQPSVGEQHSATRAARLLAGPPP